jgi:hypothetical protein
LSIFDNIKGKAEGLISGNEEKIKEHIEKAGDFVDGKTGDKYQDQINKAQSAASNYVDRSGSARQ